MQVIHQLADNPIIKFCFFEEEEEKEIEILDSLSDSKTMLLMAGKIKFQSRSYNL
jgi:hypothetical protein